MGKVSGERSVEIAASVQRCFAIAADIERAPAWQGSLISVAVLQRDDVGRPLVVDTRNDARVRHLSSRLRFAYDEPGSIHWTQERGDVRSLVGRWTLEALEQERTRATYALEVDPGRMLGLLIRGPVEAQVRDFLLGSAAQGLKRTAEAA